MGLIGWIKKEIESTSRQRRQSAPPTPLIRSLSSPTQEPDEAYMKAVSKFNQWRSSQRFERLNETNDASAIAQNEQGIDDLQMTDVSIDEHERQKLIQMSRLKKTRTIGDQSCTVLYSNYPNSDEDAKRKKRLSLPTMQSKSTPKSFHPTSTFEEIEEFEQNHCQEIEDFSIVQTTSPPVKFFRSNSEPYGEDKTETSNTQQNKQETPKRGKIMGRGMLRRNKGKAPQPPTPKPSETSVNFINGNFQHYDVTSASIYDEFVITSSGYKGKMRKEQPQEKINSVGESASSGSLSSDPGKKELKKQRRLSPPYQTVINKHGDEVEYALPYNERDSLHEIPPLPAVPAPQFDQIIDQNFKFLNSKIEFLNSQIDHHLDPIDASFSDVRRQQNLQVTDLDKSNEAGLAFPPQCGDIIRDLDALAKWSQNLKKMGEHGDVSSSSPIDQFKSVQNNIKIFNVNEIKYKSGALRNSFSTPLEFSNGYFHQTPITLRSTLPNLYSISNFADLACKREFEILAQIKHANVTSLMGISYDEDLRITSLIIEPFDFTLNHYLHQMDKFYSIQQTVSIMHQIASATRYLHENGFVHSNISSHAVLIRENPTAVKLASFELVTEILPRESIGKIYHMNMKESSNETVAFETSDIGVVERYNKLSKQHFYNRTSLPVGNRDDFEDENENEYRLPYSIAYRRMFSMHYYQAPELLIPTYHTTAKHVMPTPSSDIYALGLLLWESINRAVPYVIFNHDELIKGLQKSNIQLPMLDKSCIIFKEIFDATLCVDVGRRLSEVSKFITMLEDLHVLNYQKDKEHKIQVLEIIEPSPKSELKKTEKNIKNTDQKSKLREKEIYFSRKGVDPHKRFENALTSENLQNLGVKDTSKISESVLSSEIEPHMSSFTQQPQILQDDAIERIRKTVENQRGISPKKPLRKRGDEEVLEMSKNSTMFQSFFDFTKLQTPKVDKDVIYERTSTLKKRLKAPENEKQPKKSVKELFDKPATEKFEKMDAQLDQIQTVGFDKADFMQEIVQTLKQRKQNDLSVFLNQGMATNSIHEHSRSFEHLPVASTEPQKANTSPIKRSESDLNYRFTVGDYSLPNTPIARQNKIRRNAWLSDERGSDSTNRTSQEISRRTLNFNVNSNNSPINRKKYNVNIKIHHNDLENSQTTAASAITPKDKSTNLNNSSLVNVKLYNSSSRESPKVVTKVNNIDLNRSSYAEDINKKYYPNMPELLSDVFQNKRGDKSLMQLDEEPVQLREKDESLRVVIPVRSSVKDTIKYIEQTFNPTTARTPTTSMSNEENGQVIMKNNETQTDDDVAEYLNKVSESIQKLETAIPKNIVHKRLETLVNASPTPKKVTTKVTLNLQKFTGRTSDVSHIKQVQEQARHSICNNAEIIKRIQMHFQAKDQEAICNTKNSLISSSCSSLVHATNNEEKRNGEIKHNKYSCRNCGYTMIAAEPLRQNGRLSIVSTESLQAIRYDETLAMRKCNGVMETRSTEDLYIDDDFCQGITQSLAANMELLPSRDLFDSIDFNILSAEFFQTHEEHEYDATLTESGNVELKQIEYPEMQDYKPEVNEEEAIVQICDKQEGEDEPKVEN